ncbi:hypothetical protein JTE90_026953 [Oedothorax gibbosus]|uniref:Uncharacterized protein n=1 Tax=Oedothorax gibbosus TaxID=931172 RepID=A0AAV6UXW4_9ARAC|nr:hypothetical protein JTE90_026953 [Oedothorax gibbosus]
MTPTILLTLALASFARGQMMPPMPPPPLQAPPPYNLYGPINPYSTGVPQMYPHQGNNGMYPHQSSSGMYPQPQQMMSPPMYPTSTSASYAYPMMAAAAPFPSYGVPPPPPVMYPPPYQTFSGAGPNGDPFTSTSG